MDTYSTQCCARASVRHSTPANVLVPLKDVKYEGDLKCFHVHPTTNVDPGGWIWLAVNGEDWSGYCGGQ